MKAPLLLPCATCVLCDSEGEAAAPLAARVLLPARRSMAAQPLCSWGSLSLLRWCSPQSSVPLPQHGCSQQSRAAPGAGNVNNTAIVYIATVSNVHILASIVSIFMSLFMFNSSYSGLTGFILETLTFLLLVLKL